MCNNWKDLVKTDQIRNIPGYDSDYFVDRDGNIYSTKSGELENRKVGDDHRGYLICGLKRNDGVNYPIKVHHAVLYAFVGPKPSVNHVGMHGDDDSYNNKLTNLSWGTIKENQKSKLKNKAKSNAHKRKLDLQKKEIAQRMIKNGFSMEEISLLTCWPLIKVEREVFEKR